MRTPIIERAELPVEVREAEGAVPAGNGRDPALGQLGRFEDFESGLPTADIFAGHMVDSAYAKAGSAQPPDPDFRMRLDVRRGVKKTLGERGLLKDPTSSCPRPQPSVRRGQRP